MSSVLNIASALNEHPPKPGMIDDWRAIGASDFDPARDVVEDAQFLLGNFVDTLLRIGKVHIQFGTAGFSETRTEWVTQIGFGDDLLEHNLFGALALQLMLVVGDAESLYFCTGCKGPYIRSKSRRRPRPDQNNYCPECGRGRALRDADRRRKDKMIEVCRLAGEGSSVAEIAAKHDTKPASIRRWLKKGK